MLKYDFLVYLGLVPMLASIGFAVLLIKATPIDADVEQRKLRMADGILIALISLFTFISILYFVDTGSAGKEIFDKATPILFTLTGTVIGYIFGSARK